MITKKIVLHFTPTNSNKPIIYQLVKDYGLEFNILKANIDYKKEGLLILELKGEEDSYRKGIDYLKQSGVKIQPLSQDIIRNDARCIDCGVCTPICPSGALEVEQVSRKVNFFDEKCIACEMCIKACPQKAIEVHF